MSGQPTALAGAKAAAVRSLQIMADEDLTDFEAVIHPQAASREADGPPASRGRGPAAFHATALWLRGAFAELRWEIHEVAAESDIVAIHSTEASSASDCVALQDGPVKGAPCGRVAEAMAQAPPLTVPPFHAVSGSYRMRHLYASAGSWKEPPPCSLSTNAMRALYNSLAGQPAHHQQASFPGRILSRPG